MAKKDRLLTLLQILQNESDEHQPLTTAQVREALLEKGCPVSILTLRDDIISLQKSGYEIEVKEKNGTPTTYGFADREWSAPELQLLIDAVSSAQFIPVERSNELIRKLAKMAGPSQREALQPRILVSEHIKAKNKKMIYTVQAIRKASLSDKKITFKYYQYNLQKEQVPKHEGTPEEDYVISPYATIWNNDRYYLVGYSDKRQKVTTFRIDRMDIPKQVQQKRVPPPGNFNIQDYTDKVFWMYDGEEEQVILRCKHSLMDQMIDKFGEGIEIRDITEETFDFTVPVRISSTFYAWVTQFVGELLIVSPEYIKKIYSGYLTKAIDYASMLFRL